MIGLQVRLLLNKTLFITCSWSQQIAFPGAEGYEKYAKGGRSGVVYEVTNQYLLQIDNLGQLVHTCRKP
jgi:hypothetical protein